MLHRRQSANFFYDTPRTRFNLKINEDTECNEKTWAISGLIISFLVIFAKICTNYSMYFNQFDFFEK